MHNPREGENIFFIKEALGFNQLFNATQFLKFTLMVASPILTFNPIDEGGLDNEWVKKLNLNILFLCNMTKNNLPPPTPLAHTPHTIITLATLAADGSRMGVAWELHGSCMGVAPHLSPHLFNYKPEKNIYPAHLTQP